MTDFTVKIAKIIDETADVRIFILTRPDGGDLPLAPAGSHIDVHPNGGPMRQYSLCNPASDRSHYRIAVKRAPESRGGSAAMHDRLKAGDSLTISTPRNNFALQDTTGKTLLIAGGIGITPILSMALQLQELGRDFSLQYFTRSIPLTPFRDELLASDLSKKMHLHYALDPDSVKTYLRHLLWDRPEKGQLYVCGPAPFMQMVQDVAAATWPPDTVHVEYFTADPRATSDQGDAFEIVLSRSGRTLMVPEGLSIADVLAQNGVEVELSCEQGICGTCITGVLEGTPDHRDMFMMADEHAANDKMTLCVSRALSKRLVLDL